MCVLGCMYIFFKSLTMHAVSFHTGKNPVQINHLKPRITTLRLCRVPTTTVFSRNFSIPSSVGISFFSLFRLVNKIVMPSRSDSCFASSPAVLRFGGSVLQLHRSVQHCCYARASPKAAQNRRSLFIKVSFDSHVFTCEEGNS